MNETNVGRSGWVALARREWPHWIVLGLLFAVSAYAWDRVPDRIPTHWNFRGEIDGYSGRAGGLLLAPVLAVGMYLLLLALPRFDPARANYASFTGPYAVIRAALTATMAGLHALLVATALGYPVDAGRWIPVGVGALFVVLGNVMGKVRPNYFVGIRTPWTLSSARSWERTHRIGGKLFVIAGILLAFAAILGQPQVLVGVGVFGAVSLVGLVYYSYAVWRSDPDRVPATATRPAHEDR